MLSTASASKSYRKAAVTAASLVTKSLLTLGAGAIQLALVLLLFSGSRTTMDDSVNPFTATSVSGEYSLYVNPSDFEAAGPGEYTLSRNGQPLWTRTYPFSFQGARVTNTGKIVGYAFARSDSERVSRNLGNLVVALISPSGEIVGSHVEPVQDSNYPDGSPTPIVGGIMLLESQGRYILGVRDPDINRNMDQWWVFGLSDGKQQTIIEPETMLPSSDASRWIVAAEPVAGTPLILCNWWVYEDDREGALFTLVEMDGTPVWSLPLAGDYESHGNEAKERLLYKIQTQGAIVSSSVPGVFAIRVVKSNERVSYTVEKDAKGKWTVAESARRPYQEPVEVFSKLLAGLSQVSLVKRGTTVLQTGASEERSPIHNIWSFAFDDEGNICILKRPPKETPSLLLITQEGESIQELALPSKISSEDMKLSNVAHASGSTFLVAVSSIAEDGRSECYRADFADGSIAALKHFDAPPITALTAFEDGTIAALTERENKYSSASGLFILDAEGRTLWMREDPGTDGSPDDLLSPHDIAVVAPGHVAVLDNVASTIQFFRRNGEFARVIDLEKTLGRDFMYLTHLAIDDPDGFIVYDFDSDSPAILMNGEGNPKSEFVPRFQDGRPFGVVDGIRRGPDGALWTSDGTTVLRLDESGAVNLVVGKAPQPHVLNDLNVREVSVSQSGRVYVGDEQNMTVHVFGQDGKWQAVCVPDPGDLSETSGIEAITASSTGEVFVNFDAMNNAFIHFGPDGSRLGQVSVKKDLPCRQWYCFPDGSRQWVLGFRDLSLINESGSILRTVPRRKDGHWLCFLDNAAVAPDGAIALLAGLGDESLNTYTNTGDPIGTCVLGSHAEWYPGIAFDGTHVYVFDEEQLIVFDAACTPVATAALDFIKDVDDWRGPFLYPAREELWFVNIEKLRVERFALPQDFAAVTQEAGSKL